MSMSIGIIENNAGCIAGAKADWSYLIQEGQSHEEVGVAAMQGGAANVEAMIIHMWYDCIPPAGGNDHNYGDGRLIIVRAGESIEGLQPNNVRMAAAMRAMGYKGAFIEVHATEEACPTSMRRTVSALRR